MLLYSVQWGTEEEVEVETEAQDVIHVRERRRSAKAWQWNRFDNDMAFMLRSLLHVM